MHHSADREKLDFVVYRCACKRVTLLEKKIGVHSLVIHACAYSFLPIVIISFNVRKKNDFLVPGLTEWFNHFSIKCETEENGEVAGTTDCCI